MYNSSNIKNENRKRIFNAIRTAKAISSSELSFDLHLSRPTVRQNLDELLKREFICESGTINNTGGRSAQAFSIASKKCVAVGLDLTKNHITLVLLDLNGESIYSNRMEMPYSSSDEYKKNLGNLIEHALVSEKIPHSNVCGVGIALPALITPDHSHIASGRILNSTGITVNELGKYIPYPCKLYNDANSAGYAEVSSQSTITNAFYLSLSNNVGGSVLINKKVYSGETHRSGEAGHMTIVPKGRKCYCGKCGCLDSYCKATNLSDLSDGHLDQFFENLSKGLPAYTAAWDEYLSYLAIALNNIRMLFDCTIILGGYIGSYIEPYLSDIKNRVHELNTYGVPSNYIYPCTVKKDALAIGAALPFIHKIWGDI